MRSTPTTHAMPTLAADPPPCPPWCDQCGHGWDVGDATVTKTCELAVSVAGRDVILERFAAIECGQVVVNDPQIRMDGEALDIADASALANVLLFLAGKI